MPLQFFTFKANLPSIQHLGIKINRIDVTDINVYGHRTRFDSELIAISCILLLYYKVQAVSSRYKIKNNHFRGLPRLKLKLYA